MSPAGRGAAILRYDDSCYVDEVLPPISWTDESEEHIARHGVLPEEVEQVLYSRPRYVTNGRDDTRLVYGTTDSCRYLLTVTAEAMDGGTYIVTARPMTVAERRTFEQKGI